MRSRSHVGLMGVSLLASLLGCHEARPEASPAATPAKPGRFGEPAAPASAAATAAGGIRRTLIDRRPATDQPGWETRLYLIEYPPGAVAPQHVHPAVGVGYVFEGRFESAFGSEAVVEVRAGEGFVDQAGVTHRVFRNPSPDQPLRFVVAYTIRAGDEPLRLVDSR